MPPMYVRSKPGNTHDVIAVLFRAMDTKIEDRAAGKNSRWADVFPHVNGGLFDGAKDVPRFSRIARSYRGTRAAPRSHPGPDRR